MWYIHFVFSLQNAVLFHNSNVFVSRIIHILYTGCAKIKENNSGIKSLNNEIKKQVTSSRSLFIQLWNTSLMLLGIQKFDVGIWTALQWLRIRGSCGFWWPCCTHHCCVLCYVPLYWGLLCSHVHKVDRSHFKLLSVSWLIF